MNAQPIATVTLNPALDEAIAIDAVILGSTNRCELDALDAGGKGINAARVIHRLGRATIAFGCIGGVTGQLVRERLAVEGLPLALDEVDGLTRLNVMMLERGTGRRTRFYLPGAHVAPEQTARVLARLLALEPNGTVVLGGSLPPGAPATLYYDFVVALHARGMRTLVDTSGPSLAAVLAARPVLIKPNVEEAEELLGRALRGDDAVLRAADELRRRGPEYVVISQGADGAIGAGPDGAWKARPPAITAVSTVGSGDSMVAGLAIAIHEGQPFADGLRLGTAAGAATAMVRGTQLCDPAQVNALLPDVTLQQFGVLQTR